MKYISTRGTAPTLDFNQVLLTGLARDGGLYVPESYPHFTNDMIKAMRGLPYQEVALRVIYPFVEGSIERQTLKKLIDESYEGFDDQAIAPLRQIDAGGLWVCELYHGQTLAFKDYALQLVGRLFDHVLTRQGQRTMIVAATSGDTGAAAIYACLNRKAIDIVILHPKGRVSEVQRRQMTSVIADNVLNIAVNGSFDNCQNLVKSLFNDHDFRDEVKLGAMNSINWARIMAQIVYYFYTAVQVGAPDIACSFAVPTGNFGNIFAGYCAKKMGLPIHQLVIGSNANDILTRFIATGQMSHVTPVKTVSPSMDIQVSSNFERLLFEELDRNSQKLSTYMDQWWKTGQYSVDKNTYDTIKDLFQAYRFSDSETTHQIKETYQQTGFILDPHSAIGLAAGQKARHLDPGTPLIALATAHPAKFPDAIKQAIGIEPALPTSLSDLFDRQEACEELKSPAGDAGIDPKPFNELKDRIKSFANRAVL